MPKLLVCGCSSCKTTFLPGEVDTEGEHGSNDLQFSCTPEAECGTIDIIKEVILFGFLFGGLYTLFTIG